jgi:hypothetical protein
MKDPRITFLKIISFLILVSSLIATRVQADALDNWTSKQINTNSFGLRDVTYGNGRYVAVGEETVGSDFGVILTSEDGVNWTVRRTRYDDSYGYTFALYAVTFSKGLFVAVGYQSAIYSSTNGLDWVQRNIGPTYNLYGVTGLNGRFIAVGDAYLIPYGYDTTTSNIFCSLDGITWFQRSSGATAASVKTIYGVAAVAGRYVAVGDGGYMYTTTSLVGGSPWVRTSTGGGASIAYGNGLFIAPQAPGTNLISVDGLTWSPVNTGNTNRIERIAYGNGIYVATSYWPSSRILTSTDGTNWVQRNVEYPGNMLGITFGDGKVVSVGAQRDPGGSDRISSTVFNSDPLAGIGVKSDSMPKLEISGINGRSYRIEYADSSLANGSNNWQTLTNFTLSNGPYTWTDMSATNSPQRFYRAVLLP